MQDPDEQNQVNKGMSLGFIAVAIFSLTLPMTRLIVPYLDPIFIGLGRSVIAALVAVIILLAFKQRFPNKKQVKQLLLTAIGVIAGFPVLTAFAMQTVPAAHGSVVIGLLPLFTAVIAVFISNERPSMGFWFAATIGAVLVVAYSLLQSDMQLHIGYIYLVGASILGAFGYAMGGEIAKEMGGWQVICWVNVLGFPFSLLGALWVMPESFSAIPVSAWVGFLYLALASQLFGFFLWYKGLVLGGIAHVSQTQLLQPFLSIIAAIIFLGEQVGLRTYLFALAVVVAIAVTRKMSVHTNHVEIDNKEKYS